jgi:hypothetical protein
MSKSTRLWIYQEMKVGLGLDKHMSAASKYFGTTILVWWEVFSFPRTHRTVP